MPRRFIFSSFVIWCLLAAIVGPKTAQAQCDYSISPISRSHGAGSETGSVMVSTASGCTWTAISNATWITFTSGSSGSGSGTVTYSVAANLTTTERIGTITIAGSTFTVTQSAAALPTITDLYPSSMVAGSPGFDLTVVGMNFAPGSAVLWDGAARPTTFLDSMQLRVSIMASYVAVAGSAQVTVQNPSGAVSSQRVFTILPPENPMPTIQDLSPRTADVGASLALIVTGTGFLPGSEVKWNDASLSTMFESSTLLWAPLPSNLLAEPGLALVTVFNGPPGGGVSEPAIFRITAVPPGLSPVANAGTDQTVRRGQTVTLDGSGSSDPDNDVPLFYVWSWQSRPPGSTVNFSDFMVVNPTFTPDVFGNYVAALEVIDRKGAISAPDAVTVSTINSAPIAEAGSDQIATLGTSIQLDGSQSYDPDGHSLTFQWSFLTRPTGSAAALSGADTAAPCFIPDLYGQYVIQLVVSDPWVQSTPDTVIISFENLRPVANAGTSQSTVVLSNVVLDGSGSDDANGDSLSFIWRLVATPEGSQAVITNPTSVQAAFVPDLPGTFVIQLIVSDGYLESDPSTVQVQVTSSTTAAVMAVQKLQEDVATLSRSIFKNGSMQNALLNKLNAVIANIGLCNYSEALGQLEHDILGKTNGCAATGTPDKNDWILDCSAQSLVRADIIVAMILIKNLM